MESKDVEPPKKGEASPLTLYRTRRNQMDIVPVKVIRTTKARVFIHAANHNGKVVEICEARHGDWQQYHDTEAAALDYLIQKATRKLELYKLNAHQANSALGELLSRKKKASPA